MKKSTNLILITILFLGCSSYSSKKDNELLKVEQHEANKLIGEWQQLNPGVEGSTPKVVFTEKTFTFYIKDNEPYERTYHIHDNFIIGPEHPILKERDSIKYELISKEILILNIKEMGTTYPRRYYKLK